MKINPKRLNTPTEKMEAAQKVASILSKLDRESLLVIKGGVEAMLRNIKGSKEDTIKL